MDYQETAVAGKQWKRCYAIDIQNPLGVTPTIAMQEEVVTTVGTSVFRERTGNVLVPFDPAAEVALLDPTTGESLGATMTQGQIHVALWSLYMSKALERDVMLANSYPDPVPEAVPEVPVTPEDAPVPEVPVVPE